MPNERLLAELVRDDAAARWFIGLRAGDPPWRPSALGRRRVRLFSRGIAPLFFRSVLANPGMAGLLLDRRLQPDAKLLEAWTSQESWQPGRDVARQVTSLLLMPDVSDTTRRSAMPRWPGWQRAAGAGAATLPR